MKNNIFKQKIGFNKETIYILAAFAAIISTLWGIYTYYNQSKQKDTKKIENKGDSNINIIGDNNQLAVERLKNDEKSQENILNKTVQDITSELKKINNEVRAEEYFKSFYKGKRVKWSGTIISFGKYELIDNYLLKIQFEENFSANFFDKNQIEILTTYDKNQKIEVTGILDFCFEYYCVIKAESYKVIE
jgi:hypothetical protein